MITTHDEATALQIERILNSETLRSSEALRRLLRYLAEKTLSGEADELKEYTVGVDGLGKSSAYDPRHESGVRIQLGRLRQKLLEYYHQEGREDSILVELPKGHFKLTFETRPQAFVAPTEHLQIREMASPAPARMVSRRFMGILLLVACGWASYATFQLWRQERQTVLFRNAWPIEVEALWRQFLAFDRPLVLAIADPPFADVKGFGLYRNRTSRNWSELLQTPGAASLQKIYGASSFQPYPFFTGIAEATAAFQLGQLLGPRVPHMTLLRSSELSWPLFADDNTVYVGSVRFFEDRLRSLPVELEFEQENGAIRILHPRPGDPPIPALGFGDVRGTGRQYALVSNTPGPAGKGVVRTFTSVGTSARLAALQSFSDPSAAQALFRRLSGRSGSVPKFFQLVMRVSYTDGVPTNTEYVFHRELNLKTPAR